MLADYSPNVHIESSDSGLNKDSVALIPLLTALDRICFKDFISKLPDRVMEEIYDAVLDIIHK